jgi:hypothetical protein
VKLATSVLICSGLAAAACLSCEGTRGDPIAFVGRRAYVVTARVAGGGSSHKFTVVVDADAGKLIAGADGGGTVSAFTQTSGELRSSGPFGFSGSSGSGSWAISYNEMTLRRDANDHVAGTTRGTSWFNSYSTDVGGGPVPVTATLDGALDTTAPLLTFVHDGADDDPFSSLTLLASEPLLPSARPVLIDGDGGEVPLALPTNSHDEFVSSFYKPGTVLRHAQTYRVRLDGIADFSGLAPADSPSFTTRAAPPLVAEDGFESAAGAIPLGGEIITAARGPIITGERSFYVAPIPSTGIPGVRSGFTRLAVRMTVSPGDTVIRFSYRLVEPYGSLAFYFGSEGGKLGYQEMGGSTAATRMTIGDTAWNVGPVAVAALPLPADVGAEVVLAEIVRGYAGGLPMPPVSGIIIDDLRVEP